MKCYIGVMWRGNETELLSLSSPLSLSVVEFQTIYGDLTANYPEDCWNVALF